MKANIIIESMTDAKYSLFTKRGNAAIELALIVMKEEADKLVLPDQGIWHTVSKLGKNLGYEVVRIDTNKGLIDYRQLKYLLPDSRFVFFYQSIGGYFVEEPMDEIYNAVKQAGGTVILDVSPSLGKQRNLKYDIAIASFGKWKPVDNKGGGVICLNDKELFEKTGQMHEKYKLHENFDYAKLSVKLNHASKRYSWLSDMCMEVKKELKFKGFECLFPESQSLVVIAKYANKVEKQQLIDYCNMKNYPYTECPREIRANIEAISIEIKRLENSS